jgi:spectinomycin phosphotransferase/16S rRNA (guanine(1405)-N(7))-methyltransferase
MLTAPADLALETLTAALTAHWGVVAASADYRPLGFGAHHWEVIDPAGGCWFATVDDLEVARRSGDETHDAVFTRLRRALDTARALRDTGAAFVLAPMPTAGGEQVVRIAGRYALSLYPYVDGESFDFGGYAGEEHRQAVLDMVIRVHGAPESIRRMATPDDLGIRSRDALDAALDGRPAAATGPFAEPAARLLADHETGIREVLADYDALVASADHGRAVLTHGEPHPGNTMRTADGWRLIDWDTVRVSLPERDLWLLGGDLDAYTDATGVGVRPDMLELFRLRWHLTDLCMEVYRFRGAHTGDANDEKAWEILRSVVGDIRPRRRDPRPG